MTNGKLCDIIQRSLQNDNHGKERMENKNLKKVEKTFKKYLTNAKRCGIINKLSERQIKPQGKAYVPWKLNNERREKERTNTRTIPFHEKWRKKSFVNDLGHWTENVQQSKEQMLKLLK